MISSAIPASSSRAVFVILCFLVARRYSMIPVSVISSSRAILIPHRTVCSIVCRFIVLFVLAVLVRLVFSLGILLVFCILLLLASL